MFQKLFGVAWQVPLALFALSALFTVNAQAQSNGWRVTESKVVGSKVYLDLDLRLLEDQLEILHNGVSGASSSTWGDVLTNGGNPGMDVNFSGYDALGLEDVTAAGTMTADSLVLSKDAFITGRLNVTNVVTLSDSLKVSGFVEFGDSLEVVKAVTIGETLYVTGVTSLGDSLHVVGNVDFDALFNVDGAATFGSTLTVTGETTLNDSLHVNSGANITGTLYADSISVTDVINGQVSSLANHDTDDLSEGSTNLYFTDARARAAISEGTGVTITNGQIAIGQAVSTTSDVTFDELYADSLQASGTLTVTGFTALNDSLHVIKSADIDENLNVDGSVSIGGGTASGSRSMARGFNAVASGAHALALDSLSTAAGMSSKAIGRESSANATDAIALGFKSKAATSGWSSGNGWHAVAMGAESESAGTHSYSMGALSTVNSLATNAYALGYSSKVGASAQFGIAMGAYSELGSNYVTGGIALGYGSQVGVTGYAPFAMAFGYQSKAENASTMAFGYQSQANMWHAMAFGQSATASGSHAMAFGQSSTASMDQAITFGHNSTASGPHAIAFGQSSTASGYSSRAFGYQANASGSSAFALGHQSNVSGYNAFGFGNQSKATAGNAMAMGDNSEANAWNSLALGYKAKTTGSQSFVHAAESEATSLHQVILGSYADATPFSSADAVNWVETDPLVVIGNGSSTADRTNAFVMLKDGSAMFSDSLHVGRNLDVTGTLDISGITTLNDSLHVNSGADINATLYADSISTPGLNVTENFTFTDGTEGAGKVLTSDANGNAYWATASGGGATYTAGTGVDLTNDVISIGQAVSTTSDVTFDELYADSLQASGTLTVAGVTALNDSAHVQGHLTVGGPVTISDSLTVTGNLNVSANGTVFSAGVSPFIPNVPALTQGGYLNHEIAQFSIDEQVAKISTTSFLEMNLVGVNELGFMSSDPEAYYMGLLQGLLPNRNAFDYYSNMEGSVLSGQISTVPTNSDPNAVGAYTLLWARDTMMLITEHLQLYSDTTSASGRLQVAGITTLNDSLHVNSGADINATLYADSISTPGLNVTENFTFTDGTQGAGKMLTSDANGNATWSDAPLGFNHYEAWIDHASIVAGVTASTTSAHMYVDSTSTQSYDPSSFFGLSAGQITVSSPGYYEIEGYVFGTRSTTGSGFVTASVQVGTTTLPQCTATEEWTSAVSSSVRTNCRVLVNPGQAIQLNIIEQSFGTSNISDAGIVIRKVGTALTPP